MKDLFVLPFDHRGSFQKLLGRARLDEADLKRIVDFKRIIFEAFERALAQGVPRDQAGILVDEQYGTLILDEARVKGYQTACPAEKSGQDEFDFEYGDQFKAHIDRFSPTYVKALMRYNPAGDASLNHRQNVRMKELSDHCRRSGSKLMLELLVCPTPGQLGMVSGDPAEFDRKLRPELMLLAMREIQAMEIEPAIWKLEGIEDREAASQVAEQGKGSGIIILGRGESQDRVHHWVETAARVPGWTGFAIGRTLFWDALTSHYQGKIMRAQAIDEIAHNYLDLCQLWMHVRAERRRDALTRAPDLTA